jgi:hypothetical protein
MSQPCGPPRPVRGIALLFFFFAHFTSENVTYIQHTAIVRSVWFALSLNMVFAF